MKTLFRRGRFAALSLSFPALACAANLGAQAPGANIGLFDAATVLMSEEEGIEAMLDFDADGNMDVLSVWWTSGTTIEYRGFRNDGTGSLTRTFSVVVPAAGRPVKPTGARVGNLDGDGRDDFVSSHSDWVRGFTSTAGGGFPSEQWIVAFPAAVEAYAVADFNGDQLDDVAVLSSDLRVYLSVLGGPPVLATTQAVPSGMNQVVAVNLDGSGPLDVAVLGNAGVVHGYTLEQVSGQMMVQPFSTVNASGVPGPRALTTGDIDGDGDADMVVFGASDYIVVRRVGVNLWSPEVAQVGGPATMLLDIDGDGDLDGGCCGGGGFRGYIPTNASSIMRISLNDGAGNFAAAHELHSSYASRLVGGADLNNDGAIDLIAGRGAYFGGSDALPNGPHSPLGIGRIARASIVDIDSDGDLDFQVGLGPIQVNHGDGSTSTHVVHVAPPSGSTLVGPGFPGDFDGDGDADLVVEEHRAGAFFGMRLLENRGAGGFADAGPAAASGVDFRVLAVARAVLSAEGCVVGDVDGDGDDDLVVRAQVSVFSGSRVWINDGAGRFTAGQVLPMGYVEVVHDWTGDGVSDLLAGDNRGVGMLRAFPGRGDGTFDDSFRNFNGQLGRHTYFSDHANTFADVDGDGHLDVLATDGYDATLYLGNGADGIRATMLIGRVADSRTLPGVALAADLNSDGVLDLVTGPARWGMNSVYVHLGEGPAVPGGLPRFAPPMQQFVPAWSLADLDGDGDVDVIGRDGRAADNRWFEGPAAGASRQHGSSLPGKDGMELVLGSVGPFRVPGQGALRLRGGVGGGLAVLALGLEPVQVPVLGGTLLLNPLYTTLVALDGRPGIAGEGSLTFPWNWPSEAAGLSIVHQFFVFDAEAIQGLAFSPALTMTFGW